MEVIALWDISEKEFKSKDFDKADTSSFNKGVGECAWLFSGEQNNCITFHLTQLNVRKLFAIDYLTCVFNNKDIQKMYDIIFYLIEQVVGNLKNTIISNLQVLPANEVALLKKFNNTVDIKMKLDKVQLHFWII